MTTSIAVVRRIWRQTIVAGLSGLLLGSLCGCALIIFSDRRAPVLLHEERELRDIVTQNGHIDLYIDLDRTRDCPAETSRWLWTWIDVGGQHLKQYFPLMNTTTTLSKVGHDQQFVLSLPVPSGVWPGNWFYWSKTVEHCPFLSSLFRNPTRESQSIPVRVVDEAS